MNYCCSNGVICGSSYPIPESTHEYLYRKRSSTPPCSHIVCRRCDAIVKHANGAQLERPLAEVYDQPAFLFPKSDVVKRSRLYFCRCQSYSAIMPESLEGRPGPYRAPPDSWACGGHPPPVFPCKIGGIELPRDPDWEELLIQHLRQGLSTQRQIALLQDFYRVVASLHETPNHASIRRVIKRWVDSEDAIQLATSIHFFWHFQDAEGARRVRALLHRDSEHLLKMVDPFSKNGETILASIVAMIMSFERSVIPLDDALKSWARVLSAQPNGLRRTLHFLVENDYPWILENLEILMTGSPAYGVSILREVLIKKSLKDSEVDELISLVERFPETDQAKLARTLQVFR